MHEQAPQQPPCGDSACINQQKPGSSDEKNDSDVFADGEGNISSDGNVFDDDDDDDDSIHAKKRTFSDRDQEGTECIDSFVQRKRALGTSITAPVVLSWRDVLLKLKNSTMECQKNDNTILNYGVSCETVCFHSQKTQQ